MENETIRVGEIGGHEECPVELTALVLCRAASPHLFRDLATGPKTFTELRATIVNSGASSSRTLAALGLRPAEYRVCGGILATRTPYKRGPSSIFGPLERSGTL